MVFGGRRRGVVRRSRRSRRSRPAEIREPGGCLRAREPRAPEQPPDGSRRDAPRAHREQRLRRRRGDGRAEAAGGERQSRGEAPRGRRGERRGRRKRVYANVGGNVDSVEGQRRLRRRGCNSRKLGGGVRRVAPGRAVLHAVGDCDGRDKGRGDHHDAHFCALGERRGGQDGAGGLGGAGRARGGVGGARARGGSRRIGRARRRHGGGVGGARRHHALVAKREDRVGGEHVRDRGQVRPSVLPPESGVPQRYGRGDRGGVQAQDRRRRRRVAPRVDGVRRIQAVANAGDGPGASRGVPHGGHRARLQDVRRGRVHVLGGRRQGAGSGGRL
mmetsp:Transcript_4311/g.18338  ORF Transcript_4311/g.18338 Transcript_4311/m.18338 type:complete len:330 (+) Transcript_4311:955-1944(+)